VLDDSTVGAAEQAGRRALKAAREARLALAPRPVDEWAGLAVCRDVYPRIHLGVGRKITLHVDPGHAQAVAAGEAGLALRKAAARHGGAVPAALAAAARASADALVDPSLVAALLGRLGVMPVVRYIDAPETRRFLLDSARRCTTHRLELRWTRPLGAGGECAVATDRWLPEGLHPTLAVPPPQRLSPSHGWRRDEPRVEPRIEPRPVAVLYAVLAPRRGGRGGGATRLFERSRALDPVEERPVAGGPQAMDAERDQRAAFEHGEAQSACDRGLPLQGAGGPLPEQVDTAVAPGQFAPLLYLRY